MPRLGELDTRIAWLKPTTSDDTYGGQTVTWAVDHYAWAAVEPLGGREALQADALHPVATHRLTTWRDEEITLRWRVQDVEDSTLYELLGIALPTKTWMVVEMVEVVA